MMNFPTMFTLPTLLLLSICVDAIGQEDNLRAIPLTRPEMKQMIEAVKQRAPRIPLPELTQADRDQLGERADSYESRLRHHYLDGGDQALGNRSIGAGRLPNERRATQRPQDPMNSLDNAFKVQLFWIVSRTNNCPYCIGHQETKLLAAGVTEDRIAALDSDWKSFSPAERTAFAFARKYTYAPQTLEDSDINELKRHFSDMQILEMMLSMAGNNAINRWKEGVGVPQHAYEGGYSRLELEASGPQDGRQLPRGSYLTPTAPAFAKRITQVAPIFLDANGQPTSKVICARPALESRVEVERQLAEVAMRQSRLSLIDEATTRQRLAIDDEQTVNAWMRLMANFPVDGVRRVQSLSEVEENRDLTPLLKAQLNWIVARLDRAWYAVARAKAKLVELGTSQEAVYKLDSDWSEYPARQRALFNVARNLAASPVVLTDRDVAEAVELAGPAAVVQVINYVTHLAAFNRLTEAAGLPTP